MSNTEDPTKPFGAVDDPANILDGVEETPLADEIVSGDASGAQWGGWRLQYRDRPNPKA